MNFGTSIIYLAGLRAAGSKHNGNSFGGVYYPKHTKNGNTVNARWEGIMFLNRRDYTDSQGNHQEGSSETLRLVVWNSNGAKAGKGLADIFAKCISVGKELSCSVDIHSFDKRMFINEQLLTDQQGNAITYPAINFRVTGDLSLGDDSSDVIKAETAAYTGQATFNSRPALWNTLGHVDNEVWKNIVAQRMSSVYNGTNSSYGYARVVIPEGAQLVNEAQAQAQSLPASPVQAAQQVSTPQQMSMPI